MDAEKRLAWIPRAERLQSVKPYAAKPKWLEVELDRETPNLSVNTPDLLADFLPTLCELTGASQPAEAVHDRSFAPQLRGKPGHPREWIHIQNADDRQVRNSNYMLNNKDQLRRVVQLWEAPAKPNENKEPEKEAAAHKTLQEVLSALGK